jgi:hypothetical protein
MREIATAAQAATGATGTASKVRLPKNLAPYLPRLLWLWQMGIILFRVYDPSPGQKRTGVLFDKTLRMIYEE